MNHTNCLTTIPVSSGIAKNKVKTLSEKQLKRIIDLYFKTHPFKRNKIILAYGMLTDYCIALQTKNNEFVLYNFENSFEKTVTKKFFNDICEYTRFIVSMNLKRLIKITALTQKQVSKMLNMSEGSLSSIINGKTNIQYITIKKLQKIFECSLNDIVGYDFNLTKIE